MCAIEVYKREALQCLQGMGSLSFRLCCTALTIRTAVNNIIANQCIFLHKLRPTVFPIVNMLIPFLDGTIINGTKYLNISGTIYGCPNDTLCVPLNDTLAPYANFTSGFNSTAANSTSTGCPNYYFSDRNILLYISGFLLMVITFMIGIRVGAVIPMLGAPDRKKDPVGYVSWSILAYRGLRKIPDLSLEILRKAIETEERRREEEKRAYGGCVRNRIGSAGMRVAASRSESHEMRQKEQNAVPNGKRAEDVEALKGRVEELKQETVRREWSLQDENECRERSGTGSSTANRGNSNRDRGSDVPPAYMES